MPGSLERPVALKAAELHAAARRSLDGPLARLGFRRGARTRMASWIRAEGDRWLMLWFQPHRWNGAHRPSSGPARRSPRRRSWPPRDPYCAGCPRGGSATASPSPCNPPWSQARTSSRMLTLPSSHPRGAGPHRRALRCGDHDAGRLRARLEGRAGRSDGRLHRSCQGLGRPSTCHADDQPFARGGSARALVRR